MRYPTEFIERLRDVMPISAVIGKRIPVRKHGREFQALCPFHKEKSPSFTINDDKAFYHCFGCGAHGDAINFIREYEGISYREAIERLASEAGVPLPAPTREESERERKRHTLEDILALAAQWFQQQLHTSSGAPARDYLEQRATKPDMVEAFQLGFAPNQRDALRSALARQGVAEALMIEAGLLARADDGAVYDRFRGRLIFPIMNAQGKVIAFGGRILPFAQTPNAAKYLNSPETPLFKKGENLFAYHKARRSAQEAGTLLVAEGYMDVIALHAAGFTHAVAPLGTAITEQQLALLWRSAPEPILCLDGDAAGKRAMARAAELALPLIRAGYGLRFARLPAGEDPDSLIKAQGRATMETVLSRSIRLSEALWEEASTRIGTATAEQRAALEHFLQAQAERVGDKTLGQHLLRFFRDRIYSAARTQRAPAKAETPVPLRPLPEADAADSHMKPIEDQIIAIILLHPLLLDTPPIEERFAQAEFRQSVLDKLRADILEIHAGSQAQGSDALCAALAERGFGEKVNHLLHSEKPVLSTSLRSRIQTDGVAAAQAFDNAFFAYDLARTDYDIRAASEAFQRDMTEENQSRLYALKQYRQSLEKTRYSVMPDEHIS